jgi:hypothetical protein
MSYSELLGPHEPNHGDGLTVQDLLMLLRSIPVQARNNYVMVIGEGGVPLEVTGVQFAQSDQAEKWEFKVYLKTEKTTV